MRCSDVRVQYQIILLVLASKVLKIFTNNCLHHVAVADFVNRENKNEKTGSLIIEI